MKFSLCHLKWYFKEVETCAWYVSYLGQLGRDQSETQAGSLAGLTSGLVPSSSAEHGNCLHTLTSCRTVGAPWQVLHGQLWRSRQFGWGGVSPSELQSPDLGHNRRVVKFNDSNVTADHTWCGHLCKTWNTSKKIIFKSSTQFKNDWFYINIWASDFLLLL